MFFKRVSDPSTPSSQSHKSSRRRRRQLAALSVAANLRHHAVDALVKVVDRGQHLFKRPAHLPLQLAPRLQGRQIEQLAQHIGLRAVVHTVAPHHLGDALAYRCLGVGVAHVRDLNVAGQSGRGSRARQGAEKAPDVSICTNIYRNILST